MRLNFKFWNQTQTVRNYTNANPQNRSRRNSHTIFTTSCIKFYPYLGVIFSLYTKAIEKGGAIIETLQMSQASKQEEEERKWLWNKQVLSKSIWAEYGGCTVVHRS